MNNPTETSKIIQLGYVIANVKTQKVILKKSIIVNPHEQLTDFIIGLTGIAQKDVDSGVELTEAYLTMVADIEKHQVNKHPVQWGGDHYTLRNQLELSWKDFIFRPRGHDIKSLYQLYAMCQPNGSTVSGLGVSMKKLGLEFEGTQHNAAEDAYNTLRVMFHLQNKFKKFDMIKKVME
jgi:inhibitor of KinA sporulation pathway (predicted exonuclease)